MTRICEYDQVNEGNQSHRILLQTGVSVSTTRSVSRKYFLSHHTEGFEPAGSMARWTQEKWTVRFYLDGSYHGRQFDTEHDARVYFHERTTKDSKS